MKAAVVRAFGEPLVIEERPDLEPGPLTCAGVTTYKALKVADVNPAQLAAISGVGGLGHRAVLYDLGAGR
ncbi:hypothetical protein AAW14_20715 [Streptomyces hygroscopicus]|nr:hypothetical protein [Streptomyces hygroscopicus]